MSLEAATGTAVMVKLGDAELRCRALSVRDITDLKLSCRVVPADRRSMLGLVELGQILRTTPEVCGWLLAWLSGKTEAEVVAMAKSIPEIHLGALQCWNAFFEREPVWGDVADQKKAGGPA
jgi:hypothetical protein